MSDIDPLPVDMSDTDPPAPVELEMFDKKWNNMFPHLQDHAMRYFDDATVFNYAQCSKLCNTEMHRIDKHVPKSLRIDEWKRVKPHVVADLQFFDKNKDVKRIEASFYDEKSPRYRAAQKKPKICFSSEIVSIKTPYERSISKHNKKKSEPYNGHYMDAVIHYLTRQFEHNRKPMAFPIFVRMDQWPAKLSNFLDRYHSGELRIHMSNGMYKQFMDAMKNNESGRPLCIEVPNFELPESDILYFKMPREFFDSKLFQKTKRACFACNIEMTDSQFLSADFDFFEAYLASISAKAIHEKLVNIFSENPKTFEKFWISAHNLDKNYYKKKKNRKVIMDGFPFKEQHEPKEYNTDTYFVTKPDGKFAALIFFDTGIAFHFNLDKLF